MNTRWQITPFIGMNELKFGLSRSQVRTMLSAPFKPFRKGPFATNDTDSYDGLGFHLYYDQNDNLEFIDAFSPCNITFNGMTFFKRPLNDIVAEARSRNLPTRVYGKDTFCFFDEQGIALQVQEL